MPLIPPDATLARQRHHRKSRNQRFAWLIVLFAALGMALLVLYVETRHPERQPPLPGQTPRPVPPGPVIEPPVLPPVAVPPAAPKPAPRPTPKPEAKPENVSQATTPRAYRQDAARHLYARNAARIYKGKLQPLLYAVGVLQVSIDRNGRVRSVSWMRAPRHAPEVMREIVRTVRAAAPYPAPVKMNGVVYTDTWLWDKSGKFQLDTLTEGQL